MTSTAADTFARFVDVLADSLDDHDTDGAALAARLHLSRFHCDRWSPPRRASPRPRCAAASCSSARPTG